MLSRLPCLAKGPVFRTGFATLRTQARTTLQSNATLKQKTVVQKDWHYYGKLVSFFFQIDYTAVPEISEMWGLKICQKMGNTLSL